MSGSRTRRRRCASTFKAPEHSFRRNSQRITCVAARHGYFPAQRIAPAFRSSKSTASKRSSGALKRALEELSRLEHEAGGLSGLARLRFREVLTNRNGPARNLQKRPLTSWIATHIWRLQQRRRPSARSVTVSRLFLVGTTDARNQTNRGRMRVGSLTLSV